MAFDVNGISKLGKTPGPARPVNQAHPAQAHLAEAHLAEAKAGTSSVMQGGKLQPGQMGIPSGDSPQRIKEAAGQFEALLLNQMFQAMWKTVPSAGLLSGSNEEECYREMLNEAMADSIASGQGIGIKEVIVRDMERLAKGDKR